MRIPRIGARVRILATPVTSRIKLADKIGVVIGMTTPSRAGAEALGPSILDRAIHVRLERDGLEFWLPVNSVELVDYDEATTIRMGKKNLIRGRNGQWRAFKPN